MTRSQKSKAYKVLMSFFQEQNGPQESVSSQKYKMFKQYQNSLYRIV
mgnify:CR=1 FL=1